MKTYAIAIAALLSASPALAHRNGGEGMSGPSRDDVMITSYNQHASNTTTETERTSTSSSRSIELHRVFEKDLRVEEEIVALMQEGRGNSPRAIALKALDLKLANKLRQLGFTGS